jgi:hypothetical protein
LAASPIPVPFIFEVFIQGASFGKQEDDFVRLVVGSITHFRHNPAVCVTACFALAHMAFGTGDLI